MTRGDIDAYKAKHAKKLPRLNMTATRLDIGSTVVLDSGVYNIAVDRNGKPYLERLELHL